MFASGQIGWRQPAAAAVDIEQAACAATRESSGDRVRAWSLSRGVQRGPRVKTGSGRIEVEGEPTAEWHIGTASGNIDLKTPSQVSFNFDGSTLSGNVNVDRPLTVQGLVSRHHLQGKAGNGGVLLEARTLSGNIRID